MKFINSKLESGGWKLFLILLTAFILRTWNLNSIPPHLTPDEAALGYNAYSILKTGKDEHGEVLPIIFKSFGDFKPGLYVYMTVPVVFLFGLNEWSTRLPSAFAGVVAVWLLFLIVKKLKKYIEFGDKNYRINLSNLEYVAGLVLAISPWHIHFSRGAWEANLSLTLTLAGIYFFFRFLENSKNLLLSSLFFSLTYITYQGSKLSTSIVGIVLIVIFWKELWIKIKTNLRVFTISVCLGLFIALPIMTSFASGKTGRLEVYSIFSYPRKTEELSKFLDQGQERLGDFSYYFWHSETYNFARAILGRWFNHFSGRFLFFEGDWSNPRHSAPNHGVLLLSDILFLSVGLLMLVKTKGKFANYVVLWLILSPLPAALSRNEVHAIRSLNLVVPLTLIITLGYVYFVDLYSKYSPKFRTLTIPISVLIVFYFLGSLVYFLDSYFVHIPKHDSKNWEYGYKQIVKEVSAIQNKYQTVKIQQSFSQPYIYFLFYQKFDPVKYQSEPHLVESEYKGDVGYVENLENICFCAIDWPQNKKERGALVVADPIRIPDTELKSEAVKLIKEIKYLNGEAAFRIVEII